MMSSSSYDDTVLPDPSSALHDLFDPIRQLFAIEDRDLAPILRKLGFLAGKFKFDVVNATDVNWHSPLSTKFFFMGAISTPSVFAENLTQRVSEQFRRLSAEDVLNPGNSKQLKQLGTEWSRLCNDAASCVSVGGSLLQNVIRLAEVR